ncbi:MAG TPA: hypothetical protein VMT19_02245 [Thermoanaerobaculaceae bacterium]|nr:hypothetical protein [Thermoanaerobaculaceae bacterium]
MTEPGAIVRVSESRGRLHLEAVACRAGSDLAVVLTGGDRPHIGCVVVVRPHPAADDPTQTTVTTSVLAHPPHREEALARPLAESLARATAGTVVVAAGVHSERLTRRGISTYLELGETIALRLAQLVGS